MARCHNHVHHLDCDSDAQRWDVGRPVPRIDARIELSAIASQHTDIDREIHTLGRSTSGLARCRAGLGARPQAG